MTVSLEPRAVERPCCALATTEMAEPDAVRLAAMFKALGDPVRLRMAAIIAGRAEVCVCDISPAFDLSSGTISHHLRVLRESGLVDCERRGTFVHYRILPDALAALSGLLAPPGADRR